MSISERITNNRATNEDYEAVLNALGFAVRPHGRMFRRMQMRSNLRHGASWQGVPDMSCPKDAALFLGRYQKFEIANDPSGWWTVVCREKFKAVSLSLGSAMWAAYVASLGL